MTESFIAPAAKAARQLATAQLDQHHRLVSQYSLNDWFNQTGSAQRQAALEISAA
jgi:hypothetical protein